jgi:hypothetical protein
VSVLNEKAYKALMSHDKEALKKEGCLFTADFKGPEMEGKVSLPPGFSWFIIENQSDKTVEFHLQCFPPED